MDGTASGEHGPGWSGNRTTGGRSRRRAAFALRSILAVAIGVPALASGCGDDGGGVGGPDAGPNDGGFDARPPDAAPGTDATVTASIGPEGGELVSADGRLTVTIPEEALEEEVEIGVALVADPPDGAATAVYDLQPDGLELRKPALLLFEPDEDVDPGTLVVATWDGEQWESSGLPVVGDEEGRVGALVPHFSLWAWTRYPACGSHADCPDGLKCLDDGLCGIPCRKSRIPQDCPEPTECFERSGDVGYCAFSSCAIHGVDSCTRSCVTWGSQAGVCGSACSTFEYYEETPTCTTPPSYLVCSGPRGHCTFQPCGLGDCPGSSTCIVGRCIEPDPGCDCSLDACPCTEGMAADAGLSDGGVTADAGLSDGGVAADAGAHVDAGGGTCEGCGPDGASCAGCVAGAGCGSGDPGGESICCECGADGLWSCSSDCFDPDAGGIEDAGVEDAAAGTCEGCGPTGASCAGCAASSGCGWFNPDAGTSCTCECTAAGTWSCSGTDC